MNTPWTIDVPAPVRGTAPPYSLDRGMFVPLGIFVVLALVFIALGVRAVIQKDTAEIVASIVAIGVVTSITVLVERGMFLTNLDNYQKSAKAFRAQAEEDYNHAWRDVIRTRFGLTTTSYSLGDFDYLPGSEEYWTFTTGKGDSFTWCAAHSVVGVAHVQCLLHEANGTSVWRPVDPLPDGADATTT